MDHLDQEWFSLSLQEEHSCMLKETEPVTGHKFVIAESLVASEQWTLLCCTVLGQHNEDSGHQQTE